MVERYTHQAENITGRLALCRHAWTKCKHKPGGMDENLAHERRDSVRSCCTPCIKTLPREGTLLNCAAIEFLIESIDIRSQHHIDNSSMINRLTD